MPLQDGSTYSIDSFERLEVIGEGTYGKVYKAELKYNKLPSNDGIEYF